MRIGTGYDVHRFEENRKLILGGVEIPYSKGLKGHSDADVLVHAIMDSLLGSLALGDIGKHFPDTCEKYKNIDSLLLLKEVLSLILEKKYSIMNVDATIIAEEPKLSPFIYEMREKISRVLSLDIDQVSIKATTEEGLGFTGKKEGIAVQAVCLVSKTSS